MKTLLPNITERSSIVLENIIKDFAFATNFATFIVDIHGKETSDFYNISPFCQTIRKYPQFNILCQKCNMHGGLEASKVGRPYLYRCHAGLTVVTLPLVVNNSLQGFIVSGQSDVDPGRNNTIPMIQESESNWKSYSELRKKRELVTGMSLERIQSAANLLEKICNYHYEETDPRERISFTTKKETQKTLPQTGKEEIQNAIHFIQNNVTKPISLGNVADHVYLSENYLSRLFKEEVGITFVTYLNQQRIDRAKLLLQKSDLSIETIAHNVGFSYTSYFCKIFKLFTETTPENYRKQYKL